ncbi:unnamed protein product [Musa acuminata var. zebrina]
MRTMVEMESVIKVESGGHKIYGQTPLMENNSHSEDRDDASVELIGRREVYPAIPPPNRQNLGFTTSSDQSEEPDSILGCQTPTKNIFDPFAPGSEELVVAPKKKIVKGKMQIPSRRQLNFDDYHSDSSRKDAAKEDEDLLELVFRSFLELIVSNHIQEISAGKLPFGECIRTPISLPWLTGIAGTCPPAPRRQPGRSRQFGPEICRKLDFETDSS